MDANGTRFHLISGKPDWVETVKDTSPPGEGAAWDAGAQSMTLRPELSIFPRGRRSAALDPDSRRGAACDRFGSWYWIGQDRRSLFRSPAGTVRAVLFWSQPAAEICTPGKDFIAQTPPPAISPLAGLAVTTHHYLVVGSLQPAGLLIFDLHKGGDPLRLEFPADQPFEPFDMAATPDSGVWVLDRANRRLWGLDRYFRVLPVSLPAPEPLPSGSFTPLGSPTTPLGPPLPPALQGLPLPALDPTAVEALPDGSLLVLDRPAALGEYSRLFHYRPGPTPGNLLAPSAPLSLPDLAAVTEGDEDIPVVAYDLAYLPEKKRLYIVEAAGNQSIAYQVTQPEDPILPISLEVLSTYLPMHYFGSRALAAGVTPAGEQAIFYDVTPFPTNDHSVRWLRLQAIPQPRYKRLAWLESPVFDSRQRGCTWHRLFLDACIPPETGVQVWTRCGDDEDLLQVQGYKAEPEPYLRGMGSEIPYWEGWELSSADAPQADYTGTWETLFQNAVGRYLQVRLVLMGNGRASPAIRRLRAYYPRFSYVKNYLPSAFAEEPTSAGFLERMLANMEGFYTDLEGKINQARLLFDPRSVPPDALDWLAAWVGLVLDPLWSKVGSFDRRRLMIRFARRLYDRRGTPDGLRFVLLLLLDPCLETTLESLEWAAVVPNLPLRRELEDLGLPYPTLATTEAELEELLFRLVLSAPGRSQVRIVEHWQTRPMNALQAGKSNLEAARQALQDLVQRLPDMTDSERAAEADALSRLAAQIAQSGGTPASAQVSQAVQAAAQAVQAGDAAAATTATLAAAQALEAGESAAAQRAIVEQMLQNSAHRFSVLVPENLPYEQFVMVDKLIRMEKPAHTQVDIRRFWDYFIVDQARLGIDTILGEDARFSSIILGRDYLAEGYLESAYPMDVPERTVSDRDRLGEMRL